MNFEAKPRRVSLRMLSEHDQTLGTSGSYDFSKSWANKSADFCFRLWDSFNFHKHSV